MKKPLGKGENAMRILVVDDDELAAQMTAAVLEGHGDSVVIASGGFDAMERLNADESISLIVSDQNMPLVSGLELFAELRRQGSELPFILLSGDDPALARAKEPSLDACLLKDGSLGSELPLAVEAVLSRLGGNR